MPDIMDGKAGKGFMTTINYFLSFVAAAYLLATISCTNDVIEGEIPPVAFNDIFINLDLPQYNDLSIDGGYILLNSKGVRGIILYRVSASQYNAFERNCSYQAFEACATVEVHSSGLYLTDPCCGSTFSLKDGYPTSGPARFPLRRYSITMDGRIITITDEPII